jgi:hypothetical protein
VRWLVIAIAIVIVIVIASVVDIAVIYATTSNLITTTAVTTINFNAANNVIAFEEVIVLIDNYTIRCTMADKLLFRFGMHHNAFNKNKIWLAVLGVIPIRS